ncbi:8041_t:CDS:1, partial [Racocetra persica]
DTEDRSSIEPEDRPGIELEENIDIISELDNISKNTDNYHIGTYLQSALRSTMEKLLELGKNIRRH